MASTVPLGATTSVAPIPSHFPFSWSLDSLGEQTAWRRPEFSIDARAKRNRYSFRMLRYWYMERLLAHESVHAGRALRVLEVGVDKGQLKTFIDHAPGPVPYSNWDAADVAPDDAALLRAGYAKCVTVNADEEASLNSMLGNTPEPYDAIVLLHLLEHLHDPHRAVRMLGRVLRRGGVVIGGFPILPEFLRGARERQLKRNARLHGHVSAFSPRRIHAMAQGAGLRCEWIGGAFAVRASGLWLEDRAWWLKANVAFGALFPAWPGEAYWSLRKP